MSDAHEEDGLGFAKYDALSRKINDTHYTDYATVIRLRIEIYKELEGDDSPEANQVREYCRIREDAATENDKRYMTLEKINRLLYARKWDCLEDLQRFAARDLGWGPKTWGVCVPEKFARLCEEIQFMKIPDEDRSQLQQLFLFRDIEGEWYVYIESLHVAKIVAEIDDFVHGEHTKEEIVTYLNSISQACFHKGFGYMTPLHKKIDEVRKELGILNEKR